MEELNINRIKILLLTFLVLTLSSSIGAAAEIYVNPGGSIQAAVSGASSGDTIIVNPGTYKENIEIFRVNNLTLMSASNNSDDTIIASNSSTKDVIYVRSRQNIAIKGFGIIGAETNYRGVYLESCRNIVLENNKFVNDATGVNIKSCIDTLVQKNTADKTSGIGTGIGIYVVENSHNTTLLSNKVSNHQSGIIILNSNTNTLSDNTVSQSSGNGIRLESSTSQIGVIEKNNLISNGNKGIYLVKESNGYRVKNNSVLSNGGNGIDIETSSGNIVSDNTVTGNSVTGNASGSNTHGIFLNTCKDTDVQSNEISNCGYGVAIRTSENCNVVENYAHDNGRGFYVAYNSSRDTLSGNKANSNEINGIQLYSYTNNISIDSNEVKSNGYNGIYVLNNPAGNNKISKNVVSSNIRKGIYLQTATKNTLSENTVMDSNEEGIRLENSNENDLTGNNVNSNPGTGILLSISNSNNLTSNQVQNNIKMGIEVGYSQLNKIFKNEVTDNSNKGIFISLSNQTIVSSNKVVNNGEGISFNSSVNNEVSGNNIDSNSKGIYACPRSQDNKVYNNYFNNLVNAEIKNNRCTWYVEKIMGRNVMGGSFLGGNFWGSPSDMGFSDINSDKDLDEDGIIDIPYVFDNGNITDNYPLKRVPVPVVDFNADTTKGFAPLTVQFTDRSQDATSWSWDFGDGSSPSTAQSPTHTFSGVGTYTVTLTAGNKYGTADPKAMKIFVQKYTILPVADFSASATSGYAPLNVQFTDLSQNATSWSWNFGDGSPVSTDKNPMHTYSTAGTYTASLTANNENGTSPIPKTATIAVTQESSSSSSSGGSSSGGSSSGGSSGGGSAGSSPEPAKNVEVKEISQAFITNGKPVNFDFAREATCVVYVNFDAKKTAGKTNAIAEQLKGKSTLVSDLNSGEVYKYFNVWVGTGGFATSKNMENPAVCFKVDKSWLKDKNIDQATITLSRCSDKKWSQLPTKLLKEDGKYLYFTAETPEFSFFAITGKAAEKETVTEIKPETGASKTEQNDIKSEVEKEQKTEQNTSQGKTTSIPGFETIYVVACLLTVFLYKRK